jgi:hypothetical protein
VSVHATGSDLDHIRAWLLGGLRPDNPRAVARHGQGVITKGGSSRDPHSGEQQYWCAKPQLAPYGVHAYGIDATSAFVKNFLAVPAPLRQARGGYNLPAQSWSGKRLNKNASALPIA